MNKSYVKGALIAMLLGASPVLFAQTGVAINLAGATSPNPAVLDLSDASNANLGFLMTNVNLLSITDVTTIPAPTTGMIVWNTDASLPMGVGFYYFSGPSGSPANTWLYMLNNGTGGGGGGGGTVTSVGPASAGLANIGGSGLYFSANPITGAGTIGIAATTVTAGSYGSATQIPTYTVNGEGQLTAAANVAISASGIGAVTSVTGTAPIVISGTAAAPDVNLEAPAGDVFYGTGGGSTYTGAGAVGSILYNAVASTPSWLAAGAAGDVLTMSGGVPTWAPSSAGTVTAADDGTSLNGGNTVILGAAFGSLAGQLTQNTEIPFNGQNLTFSATGVLGGQGKIGIDLPAATSAAQALEVGGTATTERIDALGTGGAYNAASAATTNYVIYANANGDMYSLPAGTTGQVLEETANGPAWGAAGGAGTVTSVGPAADGALANTGSSGLYFSSNPITGAGTIGIAVTGVTAGTYGNGTNVPEITVNAEGQLTTVTTQTITPAGIGAPSIGTGINNYITRWTPNATTLGTGIAQDNGSRVSMQTTASAFPAGDLLTVTADATDVTAILGTTAETTGWGVQGTNSATTGTTGGVYGSSASSTGYGVEGINSYTSAGTGSVNYGVYGSNAYSNGVGVEGINTAASGTNNGIGVYGITAQGTETVTPYNAGYGVVGINNSTTGTGVYGGGNDVGANYNGMAAGSGGDFVGTGTGVAAFITDGTVGTTESSAVMGWGLEYQSCGVTGMSDALNMPGTFNFLNADGAGGAFAGPTCGLVAATFSSVTNSEAIYCSNEKSGNDVYIDYYNGTNYKILQTGTGSNSCSVQDTKGNYVIMHSPETPEFYFEDYGEGKLVNGKVHIDMDPTYAKNICVNDKHPLRVYVQLEGDCKGVYVTNKTATGFDVVELDGGTSNVTFQYHIIGNVADAVEPSGVTSKFADLRFEPTPVPMKKMATPKAILKPVVASNNSK